jgi:hypothetical protein
MEGFRGASQSFELTMQGVPCAWKVFLKSIRGSARQRKGWELDAPHGRER